MTKDLSFIGEETTMKDLVSEGNRLLPASFLAVAMTVCSGYVVEEGKNALAVNGLQYYRVKITANAFLPSSTLLHQPTRHCEEVRRSNLLSFRLIKIQ